MNVLFLSSGSPLKDGGSGESTKLITKSLKKRGLSVDVFSTTGVDRSLVKRSEQVYEIPSGDCYSVHKRVGNILSPFQYLPKLDKYDILHSYGTSALPGAVLKKTFSNNSPPIVVTANTLSWICTNWTKYLEQGCPDFTFQKLLEYTTAQDYSLRNIPPKIGLEITAKALAKQADYFTVQTLGMAEILSNCGYSEKKIDVIPNLLDDRFDVSSPNPKRELIFTGRLIERKGIKDILNAFLTIEPTLTEDWELKIFGDGPLKKELDKQAKYRTNVSVSYCSYSELPDVYRDASVLIHGSKYPEPFSRTWLEAMASETSIVASENPSSHAVLSDFAELYDPFDQEDLRSTLQSVLKNKTKRDQMREEGKQHIDQYRPNKVVPQYVDVYERLLEKS